MKGLQDKVVIVTGGATLIGAAVVEVLRGFGMRVAVFDIDAEGGARAVAADPAATRHWPVDITDDAQVARGVADVAAHFGRIDALVNLACTYTDNGAEGTRADWRQALDVNLVSAVMLALAVRPHLVRQGEGAIVNFTSISAGWRRPGAGCTRSRRRRWCRPPATWRWISRATGSV